jgi:hypothetical protein
MSYISDIRVDRYGNRVAIPTRRVITYTVRKATTVNVKPGVSSIVEGTNKLLRKLDKIAHAKHKPLGFTVRIRSKDGTVTDYIKAKV